MGKAILQIYKRIFYGLYLWDHKFSRSTRHDWNATLKLSFLLLFNVISIFPLTQAVFGPKVLGENLVNFMSSKLGLIPVVVTLVFNFWLVNHIGAKNIIKEFEAMNAEQIKKNNRFVLAYVIYTVLLMVLPPLWISLTQVLQDNG